MDLKHGYPFSLIKNGLPFSYPKLQESLNTDVAIIGGGISGALAAYHLTRAGIPCIVTDARSIGLGSTCASTSLLQYELDTPLSKLIKQKGEQTATLAYLLCHHAIDELEQVCREIKLHSFEKKESLYYAAYKKDNALIRDEYQARKKAGFGVEVLGQSEIKSQFGFDAPVAILSKQAASVDAYMLTHGLLQYSMKKGLKVFDRTMISKIVNGKTPVLTTTDGFSIRAKYIVNATGYEVIRFINKKIVTLLSTYAIVSEQFNSLPDPLKNVLIWNTADPYLYMRGTDDNRIITGGRDEPFYSPGKRDALLTKKIALLTRDTRKIFPSLDFIPEFGWTGTFGTTKDSLPYIGSYKNSPNTFFALGFGGNGITFSQIAATIITDQIRGRSNPHAALFAFERS